MYLRMYLSNIIMIFDSQSHQQITYQSKIYACYFDADVIVDDDVGGGCGVGGGGD